MRGLTGELSPPQGVMETGCRRAPTALELSQRAGPRRASPLCAKSQVLSLRRPIV